MEGQIRTHLNRFDILLIFQSGFCSFHGCGTALLKITDDAFLFADEGKPTALVMLNFSKVFDSINHNILEIILKHNGLEHTALSLISNNLENISQRVFVRFYFRA